MELINLNKVYLLILCICCLGQVKSLPRVSIKGTTTITPGVSGLELTCYLSYTSFWTGVTSISFSKNDSSSWQNVATVNADGVTVADSSFLLRAAITGSVKNVNDAHMKIIINDSKTVCADAVAYQCTFVGGVSGTVFTSKAERNIKAEVPPKSTQDIVASPNSSVSSLPLHTYFSGAEVKLTCTGDVGNPALDHRWCKKGVNDQEFVIMPNVNDDDIRNKKLEYQSATCDYRRSSQRTFRISANDTQTEFLCEDNSNTTCGSGLFTKHITLKKVPVPVPTLSMTGTDTITLGVTKMEVMCYLNTTFITSMTRINIAKNITNNSPKWTALAEANKDGVKVWSPSFLERAMISGSTADVSNPYLNITIVASRTTCSDAVSYRCTLTEPLVKETVKAEMNVVAEVAPKNTFDIVVNPNASSWSIPLHTYVPGTVVTLNCTGDVGSSALTHRWCKKGVNDEGFVLYSNAEDIIQDVSLQYQTTTCDYRRTSTLTYKITNDTQVTFLCEDNSNTKCGSGLFTKQITLKKVKYATLLMTGTEKVIHGVTKLNVSCSVNSTSSQSVTSISLLKRQTLNSTNWKSIVQIHNEGYNIFDVYYVERAKVSGYIANAANAYLSITMEASNVKCFDAGPYRCVLVDDEIQSTVRAEINIDIEVPPKSTQDIIVSPKASLSSIPIHTYLPGTLIMLNCTGDVGNLALTHRWCKKAVGEKEFKVYTNSADINQNVSLEYQSGTCDYRRTSSLKYNITAEDTQIEFLCEDSSNTMCGSGLFTKTITLRKVKFAAILMSGTNKITPGVNQLEVTCSLMSTSSSQTVTSITLKKTVSSNSENWISIAQIKKDGLSSFLTRARIYGSIANVSSAYVSVIIDASNTKCSDAVRYQCVLYDDVLQSTVTAEMNVSADVQARSTKAIFVSPSASSSDLPQYSYVPGTVVTLTCTGDVGNPGLIHRWCIKGANDQTFMVYQNSDDINQTVSLEFVTTTCDYRRTSRLTYNVTNEDTEVAFMCEDNTNLTCGSGLFTKNVTLYNYIQEYETTTKATTNDVGEVASSDTQLNTLSIIFIAISTAVFVMCCMYAVWRIIRRTRQKREGSQKKSDSFQEISGGNRRLGNGKTDDLVYDYAREDTTRPNTGVAVIGHGDGYETLGHHERPNTYDDLRNQEEPSNYFVLESMPDYIDVLEDP